VRIGFSLWLSVLVMVLSALAFGQVGNGTITGTVSDQAGAVIANAMIQARNVDTGVVYTGATTNAGIYTIADLPVGTYAVSATVAGFKSYTHTNLTLAATQVLSENINLEVGTAEESVTVTVESTLLKTATGELAHNVTIEQMDALPLLGIGTANSGTSGYRNPYNTLLTLPGVTGFNPSGTFTINGLGGGPSLAPALTEGMRIEGQDATSRNYGTYNYTQMAQPSVDAVQEIAYQTSNYAPEFGQAGSVVINITMRSGTNQYHGSGYDYFVNEDLDAGDPFTTSGGCDSGNGTSICSTTGGSGGKFNPRERRNDFGGTLGGPIYIPHIYDGHNRSFFFFNYEQFMETDLYGFSDTVPTAAYLAGNFSAISPIGACSACTQLGIQKTALGVPQVQIDPNGQMIFANEIFDPATRTVSASGQGYATPFPGNIIPPSRFDPAMQKLLSFVPGANNANFTGNYVVTQPGHRYSVIPAVKIDQILTPKDRLSFYYSENNTQNQFNPTLGEQDGLPNTITAARGSFITNYQERLNYDRTITPTLLLHVGVGYLHQSFVDNSPELTFNPQQQLGLNGFLVNRNFPIIAGACTTGILTATCTNATGGLQELGPYAGQLPTYEEKPTMGASVTLARGKHNYRVGADLYLEGNIGQPHPLVTLTAGTAATSDPFVNANSYGAFSPGFGFASLLLGDFSSVSQSAIEDYHYGTQTWDMYIQDSWKVTRKLTLDYGLRWDYDTPYREEYGRLGQIDPTLANPNAGGRLGATQYASTCNCSFYKPAYPYGIGPRLGVAYQIDPKTVIRGGWGVNYQWVQNAAGGLVSTPGVYPVAANSPSYVPTADQYVNIEAPGAIQAPHWPVTNPNQFPVVGTTGGQPLGFAPDGQEGRPPRINQWSIGVQREITRNFVMEATYLGNHAVWLSGPLGFLSQLSPQYLASYGLYPTPGTGPCSSGGGVCASSTYNNNADRVLLSDTLSNPAVIQRVGNFLPYYGFPTSSTLTAALYPYPQFGNLAVTGSPTGDSKYDALQLKATKRFSHSLQAGGAFTWGQGFTGATRQDFFNPSSAVWQLQQIPPRVLTFNATYTVPRATFLPRYVNPITSGWQLGWFANYQSGAFLAPPVSTVNANYLPSEDIRVPGQPLYNVDINAIHSYNPYYTQVLNPAAWAPCPSNSTCAAAYLSPITTAATATVYYKDFRGPRTPTENANIGRNFRLGKEGRYNFQIRAEFVNVFNRTIMAAPSTSNPQAAISKNSLGIYTNGFGVIPAFFAPNTGPAVAAGTAGGVAAFTGRQGTLIGRFTF
jgi:hypothetical protein